jgi:hypothetical protein
MGALGKILLESSYRLFKKSCLQVMPGDLVVLFQLSIYYHKGCECHSDRKYVKCFYSFLRGWKIDFENTKHTSDVKAYQWKRRQSFLIKFFWLQATASPNTSRIIDHPWKWRIFWRLGPRMGRSFRFKYRKLRKSVATWQTPSRFGRALSPVPARLSFRQYAYALTTFQCQCYNCERGLCSRSCCAKIHSMMGASYIIRPSKNQERRGITWTYADPQWLQGWFFW